MNEDLIESISKLENIHENWIKINAMRISDIFKDEFITLNQYRLGIYFSSILKENPQ